MIKYRFILYYNHMISVCYSNVCQEVLHTTTSYHNHSSEYTLQYTQIYAYSCAALLRVSQHDRGSHCNDTNDSAPGHSFTGERCTSPTIHSNLGHRADTSNNLFVSLLYAESPGIFNTTRTLAALAFLRIIQQWVDCHPLSKYGQQQRLPRLRSNERKRGPAVGCDCNNIRLKQHLLYQRD